jgi:hypothetical protein
MLIMRFAALAIVCLALVSLVTAQDKLRIVDKPIFPAGVPAPIELVEIRVGDRKVKDGKILAGNTWLGDLNITFKNVSKKTIAWVEFQAGGVKSPGLRFQEFGYPYPVTGKFPSIPTKYPLLAPNEEATVWINPNSLRRFLKDVAPEEVADITRAELWYEWVLFDDNTMFSRGTLYCMEPQQGNAPRLVRQEPGAECP